MTTDTDYRRSTWALANLADCGGPDRPDHYGLAYETEGDPDPSPGATFLRRVEDGARELWEDRDTDADPGDWLDHADDGGAVFEIADGAPSVYTYERWREFTDLAAWQEDPSELGYGGEGTSMEGLAGVCLYMIAERLAWALLREWAEEAADDESEDR